MLLFVTFCTFCQTSIHARNGWKLFGSERIRDLLKNKFLSSFYKLATDFQIGNEFRQMSQFYHLWKISRYLWDRVFGQFWALVFLKRTKFRRPPALCRNVQFSLNAELCDFHSDFSERKIFSCILRSRWIPSELPKS